MIGKGRSQLGGSCKTSWYTLEEVEIRIGLRLLETASGAEGGGSRGSRRRRMLVAGILARLSAART